jgi:pantothenate kinase
MWFYSTWVAELHFFTCGQVISAAEGIHCAGFHLYRRELDSLANAAEAHARRGAAFTFNAPKFVQRIRDISRAATEPGSPPVLLPSFDHEFGDPVEKDICVLPEHRLVIVEGIYVLRGAAC